MQSGIYISLFYFALIVNTGNSVLLLYCRVLSLFEGIRLYMCYGKI